MRNTNHIMPEDYIGYFDDFEDDYWLLTSKQINAITQHLISCNHCRIQAEITLTGWIELANAPYKFDDCTYDLPFGKYAHLFKMKFSSTYRKKVQNRVDYLSDMLCHLRAIDYQQGVEGFEKWEKLKPRKIYV